MQIDGTYFLSLLDSVNIVFSEQFKNSLSDLDIVKIPIHLWILGLDQDTSKSAIRISLPLMLPVEIYHHFDNFTKQRKRKFEIEDGEPSFGLFLADSQGLQLIHSKFIGPPVSFADPFVHSRFISSRKLRFLSDVSNPGKIGIVHYQQLFLLCVDYIQLNEICALVKCSRKWLKSVLRKDRSKASMGDVQRSSCLMNVGSWVWKRVDADKQ